MTTEELGMWVRAQVATFLHEANARGIVFALVAVERETQAVAVSNAPRDVRDGLLSMIVGKAPVESRVENIPKPEPC